jgi:hypothetical protein
MKSVSKNINSNPLLATTKATKKPNQKTEFPIIGFQQKINSFIEKIKSTPNNSALRFNGKNTASKTFNNTPFNDNQMILTIQPNKKTTQNTDSIIDEATTRQPMKNQKHSVKNKEHKVNNQINNDINLTSNLGTMIPNQTEVNNIKESNQKKSERKLDTLVDSSSSKKVENSLTSNSDVLGKSKNSDTLVAAKNNLKSISEKVLPTQTNIPEGQAPQNKSEINAKLSELVAQMETVSNHTNAEQVLTNNSLTNKKIDRNSKSSNIYKKTNSSVHIPENHVEEQVKSTFVTKNSEIEKLVSNAKLQTNEGNLPNPKELKFKPIADSYNTNSNINNYPIQEPISENEILTEKILSHSNQVNSTNNSHKSTQTNLGLNNIEVTSKKTENSFAPNKDGKMNVTTGEKPGADHGKLIKSSIDTSRENITANIRNNTINNDHQLSENFEPLNIDESVKVISDEKLKNIITQAGKEIPTDPNYAAKLKQKRQKEIIDILGYKELKNVAPKQVLKSDAKVTNQDFDVLTNWRRQQSVANSEFERVESNTENISKNVNLHSSTKNSDVSYVSMTENNPEQEKISKHNIMTNNPNSANSASTHEGSLNSSEEQNFSNSNSQQNAKNISKNKIRNTNLENKVDQPQFNLSSHNQNATEIELPISKTNDNVTSYKSFNDTFLQQLDKEIIKFETGELSTSRWAEVEIMHEKLGKIIAKIEHNEQGLQIIFNVKNEESISELKELIPQMKDNLTKQGFDNPDFTFNNNQNESNQFADSNSNFKRKTKTGKFQHTDLNEPEEEQQTSKNYNYNTVEYIV